MSETNGVPKTYDVAVIGCGLMGSALARTFARNGLSVAVWNRTPERAEALAGKGISAVRAVDVAGALSTPRGRLQFDVGRDTLVARASPPRRSSPKSAPTPQPGSRPPSIWLPGPDSAPAATNPPANDITVDDAWATSICSRSWSNAPGPRCAPTATCASSNATGSASSAGSAAPPPKRRQSSPSHTTHRHPLARARHRPPI
jgi:choline dehydrogenase-like flavoprotein